MQIYGLIGQTEEGIWPEAQSVNQSVNLHFARKAMFYLLYYTESKSLNYPFCCCHFYYNLLSNNNLFVQCVKNLKPFLLFLLLFLSDKAKKNHALLLLFNVC
jgi:hypothetical protein